MGITAWKKLDVVHRKIGIKRICGYRSVSYVSVIVIALTLPLRLKERECTVIHNQDDKVEARKEMLGKWQESWKILATSKCTFCLVSNIEFQINRRNREVSVQLTQFLTGYITFDEYLYYFKWKDTDACQLCGVSPETASHTVF